MRRVLLLTALFVSLSTSAQTIVKGIVIDHTLNEPLIGATVMVVGTKSTGTVTDIEGRFTIVLPPEKKQIKVSCVGYVAQTLNIHDNKEVKVVMEEDASLIDELVVVGYGSMKKSDLTGALTQLKGEDLTKGGSIDIAHGMQGKIAGVQVQQSDGAPGGGMSIIVRGTNSFSTSSQPLYILDGVPMESGSTPQNGITSTEQSTNPLSMINPHDIESIEVLKDASATAIYGSRGANGVVLINTKKGKKGNTKVEFNANFSLQKITKQIPMLDAYTYAKYCNEQKVNDVLYQGSTSTSVPYTGTWGYKYYSDGHANFSTGVYTGSPEDYISPGWHYDEYGNATLLASANWQDEIFRNAMQQEYNVNVSGGDDHGYYLFSGNYANQEGIIKNSGYERYVLRANISRRLNKWFEIGTNSSFTRSTTTFANTLSYDTGIVRSALLFPVTYGPDMDTTTSDELNWLAANPAAYVRDTKDQLRTINWFSSSYIELQLMPELKLRQNLGLSLSNSSRGTYYGRHTQEGKAPTNGKASKGSSRWESITSESILTFDKELGKIHHLNAMGAFTLEQSMWENFAQTFWNFPDDLTQDNNVERALEQGTPTSGDGYQRLASFLARVNYTFNDRYLLTMSIRSDGSSKFTTHNKWATFLSGALAWRMSEEKFIKDLNIFSNLKLRLSYGETGNQGIGSYRTLAFVDAANYSFDNSISSGNAMITWRGPVDKNLKWETTAQYNIGVDMGFMNGHLSFTADYYHKKTRDLLQSVQIPSSTGFTNMLTNSGTVLNDGLEFTVDYKVLNTKDWKWSINGNIAFNKNEICDLDGDQYATRLWVGADNVFIQRNGCPIGAIFGYIEDGFYDNTTEVRADPQYRNATESVVQSMVGEIKYRDVNHDGKITESDRVIIGDTNPKFTYGISSELSWRDITLNFLLQGSQGNDIFNGNLQDITLCNIGNITVDSYENRWTPENARNAIWPKATRGYSRTFRISDRYVEDASYLRLKNISLSYNWRKPVKGVERILVSFSATNLFTITDYSWYDPDVNAFGSDSSRRGVDIFSYPLSRTFALGLVLTF